MNKKTELQSNDQIDYSSEICLDLIRKYTTTIYEITKLQESLVRENELLKNELSRKTELLENPGSSQKNNHFLRDKLKFETVISSLNWLASKLLVGKLIKSLRNDGIRTTVSKIVQKLREKLLN